MIDQVINGEIVKTYHPPKMPNYVDGISLKGLYRAGQFDVLEQYGFHVRVNVLPDYDKAFHSLKYSGVVVSDYGTAEKYLILPITADQIFDAKEKAIEDVKQFGIDARKMVARNADPIEIAGWLDRRIVAKEYLAAPDAASEDLIAALTIEVEVRGKGETTLELAERQILLAGYYSKAIAEIDGLVSVTLDKIDVATDGAVDLVELNKVVEESSDPALSRLAEMAGARP
jgi:hypothetical protein|tara:strand:+ start:877 stop:1563 length:687 start_codon:yes stop_codon:yes gene_type:complete